MRVQNCLLCLPLGVLSCIVPGCGSDQSGAVTVPLVYPATGVYQATLKGYVTATCDASLTEPVGILDASLHITAVTSTQILIQGSRDWYYGPVTLMPGDPADLLERVAWRGTSQTRAQWNGCDLRPSVLVRYFPVDRDTGSLQVFQHFDLAAGPCAYVLPCDIQALWSLVHAE